MDLTPPPRRFTDFGAIFRSDPDRIGRHLRAGMTTADMAAHTCARLAEHRSRLARLHALLAAEDGAHAAAIRDDLLSLIKRQIAAQVPPRACRITTVATSMGDHAWATMRLMDPGDGALLHVEWEPVCGAGDGGYRVLVAMRDAPTMTLRWDDSVVTLPVPGEPLANVWRAIEDGVTRFGWWTGIRAAVTT